jgi:hypothetical protein
MADTDSECLNPIQDFTMQLWRTDEIVDAKLGAHAVRAHVTPLVPARAVARGPNRVSFPAADMDVYTPHGVSVPVSLAVLPQLSSDSDAAPRAEAIEFVQLVVEDGEAEGTDAFTDI